MITAIGECHRVFEKSIGHAGIIDVGFIGNTGGAYRWDPSPIIDIDICLFVEDKNRLLGEFLIELADLGLGALP